MTSGLQPLLSDAVVALRAPTQVWSRTSGDLGHAAIDGLYHGDTRFIRSLRLTCDGALPEPISVAALDASRVVFDSLPRGLDDTTPDPLVRLTRTRSVTDGAVTESIRLSSHAESPIVAQVELELVPDFTPLAEIKAGLVGRREWDAATAGGTVEVRCGDRDFQVQAPGADVRLDAGAVRLVWTVAVPPRGEVTLGCGIRLHDPALVIRGVARPASWSTPAVGGDPRLDRWTRAALDDLDALRLALPNAPEDEFFGAGAPWFLTLFGRDALWAARLTLSVDARIAASTLRVLARLQGTRDDPSAAEEPGKILHELRSEPLQIPGEGVVLPPAYYGTVDATALWISLLAEAAEHGMPEHEVLALLPALRGAVGWLTGHVDAAGRADFLSYADASGHGLANQGWKDSGDSIQWRDGTLARGPIALCEVQAYAYEAAIGAAALLDGLGEGGADGLRTWAADLADRFRDRFWVTTDEGTYPAVALDRDGERVDTLTSNIGHLLGTGLLDVAEENGIVDLLVGDSMNSGFGIRTMSTGAAGYWPLSYHGGSVWTHDTAIIARGMVRAGRRDAALTVVSGLLAAAEGFGFRMPELHAGDARADSPAPVPYPAACRPQAWSAAAAIACRDIITS